MRIHPPDIYWRSLRGDLELGIKVGPSWTALSQKDLYHTAFLGVEFACAQMHELGNWHLYPILHYVRIGSLIIATLICRADVQSHNCRAYSFHDRSRRPHRSKTSPLSSSLRKHFPGYFGDARCLTPYRFFQCLQPSSSGTPIPSPTVAVGVNIPRSGRIAFPPNPNLSQT